MPEAWYLRFLSSTRGRLIAFLRRDTHTVEEMAMELRLTDNAVRAHLAALERDGLVKQRGVRRSGVGKPAYAYELTPEAEHLFAKPYAAVLRELLDVLHEQMSRDQVKCVLQETGKRIASAYLPQHGDSHTRLEAAIAALNKLGGLAELDESSGDLYVQGFDCPLAAVVPSHPEACHLAEAFVSEVAGTPVRACCSRDTSPRCRFEVIFEVIESSNPGS